MRGPLSSKELLMSSINLCAANFIRGETTRTALSVLRPNRPRRAVAPEFSGVICASSVTKHLEFLSVKFAVSRDRCAIRDGEEEVGLS